MILIRTSILISIAAIIWGLLYFSFGEYYAGLIPLSYAVLSMSSLIILMISNIFGFFRFSQIALILLLPFFLLITLGGFVNSSAVILWSLLAPIGALLSGKLRESAYWFIAFIILVILGGILEPSVSAAHHLPDNVISFFFIMNIIAVSFITFLVLNYFVKHKDKVIELRDKNRELEVTQLEKEVMLRKSDKLATLGRLSAGIAHELNNPASVALRSSKNLQDSIEKFSNRQIRLAQINLSSSQLRIYDIFKEQIQTRSHKPPSLTPLDISDREQELESWLENKNIPDTCDFASMLAKLDFGIDDLNDFAKNFSEEQFAVVVSSLYGRYYINSLLDEIGEGTGRISDIAKSLKSYSYPEDYPRQSINIHEGINNTLIMLRSQLKKGITVQREFDEDLPQIEAYGTELSQVWTNILDNAITAMNGNGQIVINTFRQDNWLIIRICDSGPGISKEIQKKIFDPFFTTKSPGEGTGLGLNISQKIIEEKHKGKIEVQSQPGKTCFTIKLPIKIDA